MNREIKFRAWNGKQMIGWGWIVDMGFVFRVLCDKEYSYQVMQFTGLRDKNGVEIYEGDVVRFTEPKYNETHELPIEFSPHRGFAPRLPGYGFYDWANLWAEVIGNIYENPELLSPTI